jgi:uncharacterized membrane protein
VGDAETPSVRATEPGGQTEPTTAGTTFAPERLEAFSDGVLAVIITITAFELKAPVGASFSSLRHALPGLLVYIFSFVYIGIYWNNHHHLLRVTPRISAAVMWANLAVLFWLSLVPVLTEWVASEYSHPIPAAAYGTAAFGAAISYWVLVRCIVRANVGSHVATAIGADTKGVVSAALYLVGIGLAALSPYLSYATYALISVIWLIPDRRLVR